MDTVNHLDSETPASVHLVLCFPRFSIFMAFDVEVGFSVYDLVSPLEINIAFYILLGSLWAHAWNMDGCTSR